MIPALLRTATALAAAAALGLAAPGLASGAQILGAQNTTVDEGTLLIERRGAPAGRESFRIVRSSGGERPLYTATAQIAYGERRIASTLSADAAGSALIYRLEVKQGGAVDEKVTASARPGRLSAMARTSHGESAKDYVVPDGAVVLEDEVFHQYALLARAPRPAEVTVVVPRTGRQQTLRLASTPGASVVVDGKTVSATHWTFELQGEARELWTDAAGRLLKVAIPARGIVAVREELPR
jgi:hypothetical protein